MGLTAVHEDGLRLGWDGEDGVPTAGHVTGVITHHSCDFAVQLQFSLVDSLQGPSCKQGLIQEGKGIHVKETLSRICWASWGIPEVSNSPNTCGPIAVPRMGRLAGPVQPSMERVW